MKIISAQLNPTIGDFNGNLEKIRLILSGHESQADLIVFSELFLTGYPPRDLLERKDFIDQAEKALRRLLTISRDFPANSLLCGTIRPTRKNTGAKLYNTALLISNGKILFEQNKSLLPSYDVFDETRYFDPSENIDVFNFSGHKLGITICEDAWNDPDAGPSRMYNKNPLDILFKKNASLFINLSASPFCDGKEMIRYKLMSNHAKKYKKPFIFVNQIGGNDELIFDGRSMAFNEKGELISLSPSFAESVQFVDLNERTAAISFSAQTDVAAIHDALVLGLRDYMQKCGFKTAVIGLSGGIDSSLVAAIASQALGPENVYGIAMPSMHSSGESVKDAEKLSENLGINFEIISITKTYHQYMDILGPLFKNKDEDITEENIQARIRGNILMAISNKFGSLTLSTGNKSELSVGYCTMYGDMSGGLSVISDVPKKMVYKLANYINRNGEIIPEQIISKAPSAELKPNQKDQDTLPPYDTLDQILNYYLDQKLSREEIEARGFDIETVNWVIERVNQNEFKRRQAAPGLKVTSKAFGMGRRMPIAANYKPH